MDVPASRYRPSPRSFPDRLPEPVYDNGGIVRRVNPTRAYVKFMARSWPVPKAFRGETLAIRPLDRDGLYGIFFGATQIAKIDIADKT